MSNIPTRIVLGMMTALLLTPVVYAGTPNLPPSPDPCRTVPSVWVPDATSALDSLGDEYREIGAITDDYRNLRATCYNVLS